LSQGIADWQQINFLEAKGESGFSMKVLIP
jgi:hypothetical protein